MKIENYGLLGQQLLNTVSFWYSRFAPDLTFIDPVTQNRVTSKVLFGPSGKKWIMRSDSLPGYIAIKAIGVDTHTLYIETSQICDEDVEGVIQSNNLEVLFNKHKRTFRFANVGGSFEIKLSSRTKHPQRCLWTIPLEGSNDENVNSAIELIDFLVIEGAFERETSPSEDVQPKVETARLLLKLDLNLVQALELEQRP
jgi:hypothetical protein